MTQAPPVISKIPTKSPQPGRGKAARPAARAKTGRLDLLRIDAITPEGLLVRRALDADRQTGQRRWTDRQCPSRIWRPTRCASPWRQRAPRRWSTTSSPRLRRRPRPRQNAETMKCGSLETVPFKARLSSSTDNSSANRGHAATAIAKALSSGAEAMLAHSENRPDTPDTGGGQPDRGRAEPAAAGQPQLDPGGHPRRGRAHPDHRSVPAPGRRLPVRSPAHAHRPGRRADELVVLGQAAAGRPHG